MEQKNVSDNGSDWCSDTTRRRRECEMVICESEYVCFLKVGAQAGRYEWLL